MFPLPFASFFSGQMFKILAILAVVAAIFGAGFKVGTLHQKDVMQEALNSLQEELTKVDEEFADARIEWTNTRAREAKIAAEKLAESIAQARAVEEAAQREIAQLNARWGKQLEKVKTDAAAALEKVRNPVVTADPTTDGMWVDAYSCTGDSVGNNGSTNGVSQAPGGTADSPLRCRLHPSTATRLIERAAEANEVVANLNHCVQELRVLSPASFPTETAEQHP